jgi:hypothetical protein
LGKVDGGRLIVLQAPTLIVHADWGSSPNKRWMAKARLQKEGRYLALASEPVGDLATWLVRLKEAGQDGCVLLGFDFPIGLPRRYAERAGVRNFLALLPQLGQADWSDFYSPAERADQVNSHRPFYPLRARWKGQACIRHLLAGLDLETVSDLRRRCELTQAERRAASPLFWTVGGQQVGKAAISGWRDVLGPALRSGDTDVAIWPFAGPLFDLFRPGRIVIVETYPAEFYTHLGVRFARRAGERSGKRVQHDRAANASALLTWARTAHVRLTPELRTELRKGFGASAEGEDRFDAVVGLFGMLNVVLQHRPPGDPIKDDVVRKIEGWILGQLVE